MRTNGIRDGDDDVGVKSEDAVALFSDSPPTALLQWENMAHVEWDPAMQNGGAAWNFRTRLSPSYTHTGRKPWHSILSLFLMATFADVQRNAHRSPGGSSTVL